MFYYSVQIGKMNKLFTYKSLQEIQKGTLCEVFLGSKKHIAVVIDCLKVDESKLDYEIKEITKVLDKKLDKNLFELIVFIHNYYIEPYSSLVPLILDETDYEVVEHKNDSVEYMAYELNKEQEKIACDIYESNDLLHLINGVTGSGKTIIFIDLIKRALMKNESAIFIIPEISLTPQFLKKLEECFGDKLAVWHSKLSEKKKLEYKKKLKSGEKKILLGTRSCIFQDVHNLSYIIVDEEQSTSYKQESRPRYHLRNVAIKRAMLQNAKLILASATPSYEANYYAKKGLIKEHKLLNRYNNIKMPKFKLIDLNKYDSYLTDELIEAIKDRIDKKEQVIILLNRKAYSIAIKCQDCKKNMECKNCSYNLTYYAKKNYLKCKQCEKIYMFYDKCLLCNGTNILKKGYGTEKLEEELCELFDQDRILRMDSDSMNTNNKIQKAYNDFLNQKYDILIGTSIIAKGFHFPNVTLVCILNADELLNIPSYKIQEKSFELITQAAGRSGRENKAGEVIIQSFNIESNLIKAVVNNDYEYMYNTQMEIRKQLLFPPYKKVIKILITSKNEKKLDVVSNKLYVKVIENLQNLSSITNLNDEYVYRVSNTYRKNIVIYFDKQNEQKIKRILKNTIDKLEIGYGVKILIDVDPN